MEDRYAVLIDIVRSREQDDRVRTQRTILQVLDEVNTTVPAADKMRATVGDEFQGTYTKLSDALLATALVTLKLPDTLDCRFGIGAGAVWEIGTGRNGGIQDGPGWWSARAAIDAGREREKTSAPWTRSWYRLGQTQRPVDHHEGLVNALLTCRDQLLTGMRTRTRRVIVGTLTGKTQSQISEELGITQSAVSQMLNKGDSAALIESIRQLEGEPK